MYEPCYDTLYITIQALLRAEPRQILRELKAKVLARPGPTGEGPGTLVVRPDSGDPVETSLKVVELLWEAFGGETNDKGYLVWDVEDKNKFSVKTD